MPSTFSLLCAIITFIAFIFSLISYSYSSYISVSTKDYTYTSIIDVSKEDYRDSQARLNQQELYFNRYEKLVIKHLFSQFALLRKLLEVIC